MNRLYRMAAFLLAAGAFFLAGCGKEKPETVEMKISKVFELKDLTGGNIACSAGIYKDSIFYVRRLPETYSIVFTDFDGKELRHFDIPVGKGPGEVMMSMGVKISDGILYFYDLFLKRLSKFDLDGNFIDSIDYSDEAGIVLFFAFLDEKLYVHSVSEVFIGEMDPENGRIIRKLDHVLKGLPDVDTKLVGGMLEADPLENEIYVGYGCKPFRIERYDTDFNKIGEYAYNDDGDYRDLVYKEGLRINGETLVNSLAADAGYVYSPHVGDSEMWNGVKTVRDEYPVEIYAFSKETRKLKYIYKSRMMPVHQGTLGVIGTYQGKLVLIISGFGKSIENISGDSENRSWRGYAVIIDTEE